MTVTRVRLIGAVAAAAGGVLIWAKWVYIGGICPVGILLVLLGSFAIFFPRTLT